jgi:hypothetical protein
MFDKDRRPYVYVAEKTLEISVPKLGGLLEVGLPYTNYAKSPAIITMVNFSAQAGQNAIQKLARYPLEERDSVLTTGKVDYYIVVSKVSSTKTPDATSWKRMVGAPSTGEFNTTTWRITRTKLIYEPGTEVVVKQFDGTVVYGTVVLAETTTIGKIVRVRSGDKVLNVKGELVTKQL